MGNECTGHCSEFFPSLNHEVIVNSSGLRTNVDPDEPLRNYTIKKIRDGESISDGESGYMMDLDGEKKSDMNDVELEDLSTPLKSFPLDTYQEKLHKSAPAKENDTFTEQRNWSL